MSQSDYSRVSNNIFTRNKNIKSLKGKIKWNKNVLGIYDFFILNVILYKII